MSSLNFLTRHGQASVAGWERIKFSCLTRDLSWRAMQQQCDVAEQHGPCPLREALTLPNWVTTYIGDEFLNRLELWLSTSGDGVATVRLPDGGDAATVLDVQVNTVIAGHNDQVALAARIGAQRKVNGWVDGPDRAWLANLIDAGRTTPYPDETAGRHLRQHPLFADNRSIIGGYGGWPHVVELLRADTTGPVVLTSSITATFPSPMWASIGQDEGPINDFWHTATPDVRWRASEEGLRRRTAEQCPMLQITPDNLHEPRSGNSRTGITWPSLAAAWRRDRTTTPT